MHKKPTCINTLAKKKCLKRPEIIKKVGNLKEEKKITWKNASIEYFKVLLPQN